MRMCLVAAAGLALLPVTAMAQSSVQEKSRLETQCSQNPGSAACAELRRELPQTTTGTLPGPGNPNRPGEGATGAGGVGSGVSGAGAGGITPQGNPSAAGGGFQTSQ